jgi:GxxExxY protein
MDPLNSLTEVTAPSAPAPFVSAGKMETVLDRRKLHRSISISRERTQRTQRTANICLNISRNMNMVAISVLCDVVRETGYAIHIYHGHGHMEKVYENALANRLKKTGLDVKQQHPLTVYDDDGTVLGDYFADLLIADCLIVELKACRTLADEHVAQLLGYLKSARIEHGLLINFGSYKFQIKKYALSQDVQKEYMAAKDHREHRGNIK